VSFDCHNSPGFKPERVDEKQFDVPPEFIRILACGANASGHQLNSLSKSVALNDELT